MSHKEGMWFTYTQIEIFATRKVSIEKQTLMTAQRLDIRPHAYRNICHIRHTAIHLNVGATVEVVRRICLAKSV